MWLAGLKQQACIRPTGGPGPPSRWVPVKLQFPWHHWSQKNLYQHKPWRLGHVALQGVRDLDFTGHSSWEVKEPHHNLLSIGGLKPDCPPQQPQYKSELFTSQEQRTCRWQGGDSSVELSMKLRTGFPWTETHSSGVPGVTHRPGLSTAGSGSRGRDIKASLPAPRRRGWDTCAHALCDLRDGSPPGSSSMGFPSNILEPVAASSSREVKLRTWD